MEELQQFFTQLPYVERVSALFMIVTGSYIVYYWLVTGDLIDTFT